MRNAQFVTMHNADEPVDHWEIKHFETDKDAQPKEDTWMMDEISAAYVTILQQRRRKMLPDYNVITLADLQYQLIKMKRDAELSQHRKSEG